MNPREDNLDVMELNMQINYKWETQFRITPVKTLVL
jgi:hypothetical protein